MGTVDAAVKAFKAGIRPIPIVAGSKKAAIDWGGAGASMPALPILELEFDGDFWIAAQAGAISGNLECIDFDDPECYPQWRELVEAYGLGDLLKTVYVQKTPKGGYHVVFRDSSEVGGNQKLAMKWGDSAKTVRIETRGEGGYFLIAPSPGYTPQQGSLAKLPVLSPAQRSVLIDAAKTFSTAPKKPYVTAGGEGVVMPGKDFDARVAWEDVMTGWKFLSESKGVKYLRRPGKDDDGISATVGYAGTDLLYVFSTNAHPFEAEASYSKFAAYAFLNHGGNFIEAAKSLRAQGYGRQSVAVAIERAEEVLAPSGQWLDEVDPESPSFLWEPYLLGSQLNLIDGKGGTNKSTLILAIAAMGSRGLTPLGEPCKPFKTLYVTQEDSAGAYASVLAKIGGSAPRSIKFVSKNVPRLDSPGCREIAKMAEGFGLIVFDPIINLLGGVVRNVLDRLEVGPVMERLREHVCYATGACVTNVRHDAMGASSRAIDERGAGSRVWPDTHRSQLAIVSAEGKDPRRYVFHVKASILVERGEPFAYGWQNGEFCFWRPSDDELADLGYTRHGEKVKAQEGLKSSAAETFLSGSLTQEWKDAEPIKAQARLSGIDPESRTFKAARNKVADWKREGFGSGAQFYWRLKDPFADDDRPAPAWAGLD